jgi:hypothetical protein
MTLSVGHCLKQTNPDGTPVDTTNYVEHTYEVVGIYGGSGYASEKECARSTEAYAKEHPDWPKLGFTTKTYLVVLKVLE